jgi:hypothetical protein
MLHLDSCRLLSRYHTAANYQYINPPRILASVLEIKCIMSCNESLQVFSRSTESIYLNFGGNDEFASNIWWEIKCKFQSNANQQETWDLELWNVQISLYVDSSIKLTRLCVISGLRCEVGQNCVILGI